MLQDYETISHTLKQIPPVLRPSLRTPHVQTTDVKTKPHPLQQFPCKSRSISWLPAYSREKILLLSMALFNTL